MKPWIVYRFLGGNNEVLYVGRTIDLYARIQSHKHKGEFSGKNFEKVNKVEYITLNDENTQHKTESFYINKFKPPFNKKEMNQISPLSVCPSEEEWITANKEKLKNISREKTKDRYRKKGNIRKTLRVPTDIIERIEKYQKDNYLGSFTNAVVQLIIKGLEEEDKKRVC